MKIITWNVNGLRAAYSKGAIHWTLEQSADIICLQEIKARPDQVSPDLLTLIQPYHSYWNPAQRPGYSGVLSLERSAALEISYGLGDERFDVEGRVIVSKYPGFTLFNIYFPNGQRGRDRVDYKLDFYELLLNICDEMHGRGENVIICGDFNTAHREIDLRNPKENENTSGFLPEERAYIDKYLQRNFVDIYRELNPEQIQYTWWTYRFGARQRNIGWRLDYFLISHSLLPKIEEVVIHEDVEGSDHCPVSLTLRDV